MSVLTSIIRGREPLTAVDVAEVIVFVASRRQNSVVADVLVLPKHQVSVISRMSQELDRLTIRSIRHMGPCRQDSDHHHVGL